MNAEQQVLPLEEDAGPENPHSTIVASSPTAPPMWAWTPGEALVHATPAFYDLLRIPVHDRPIRYEWLLNMIEAQHRDAVSETIGHLAGGADIGSAKVVCSMIDRAGAELHVEMTIFADPSAERGTRVFALVQDSSGSAEIRLRESDERFRVALENAPIGMGLLAPDGHWLLVNRALCDILGYGQDELQHKTIEEITHPDDVEDTRRDARRLFAGEVDVCEVEKRYLHKSGRVIWSAVNHSLVRDQSGRPLYALSQVRDVTHRRRVLEGSEFLAEAAQVLGSSLEIDAILRTMARLAVPRLADGCVIELEQSPAMPAGMIEVVAGSPDQEAVLRELRDRYPIEPTRMHNPVSRVVRNGQALFIPDLTPDQVNRLAADDDQLRVFRKLGALSLMIVPLALHGRVLGAITFVTGESGRHLDADDLRIASELATSAAVAIDNAQLYRNACRAARVRDEVLGFVAHDLRNPLAVIAQWGARMLESPPSATELRRGAAVILESTEQMTALIGDLLDVTRIESGRFPVDPEFVPANVMLHLALQMHEDEARAKHIEITVDATDLELVYADRQRVHQVLSNLLVNAIKFTPPGGHVTLGSRRSEEGLVISVSDNGAGMTPLELEHVFDRFWQAAHARAGGAGLGLVIAKGIVEAHGGRIWFESEQGRGTTAYFTLPFVEAETGRISPAGGTAAVAALPAGARTTPTGSTPAVAAEAVGGSTGAGTPPSSPARRRGRFVPTAAFASTTVARPNEPPVRVLVVDDHALVRAGLTAALEAEAGFEVVGGVASGEEAVELAAKLRPDVVLMDLTMPGMGGLEAIRRIMTNGGTTTVLAITGDDHEDTAVKALRAGARGYLRKTALPDELRASVRAVARGDILLDSTLRGFVQSGLALDHDQHALEAMRELSDRERNVLILAARGYSAVQSGSRLNLSPKTVETYRSRAMRKLGLESRADLVTFILQTGLLST